MGLDVKDWLYIIGILASLVMSAISAFPALSGMKYKNQKDNIDAVKVALQIAGMDATDQLELKQKVQHLQELLEKKRYTIAVKFRLGENPIIEEATIEASDI